MAQLVLVTRPLEQAKEFAEHIQTIGLTPLIQPLLDIQYIPISFEQMAKPDAILITSVHGILKTQFPLDWMGIPVFCVGQKTAEIAKQYGFQTTIAGDGNLTDLYPNIKHHLKPRQTLFYVRGTDVAHDVCAAFPQLNVQDVIVYNAHPAQSLSADVIHQFDKIDILTVFSARSGAVLKSLLEKHGLATLTPSIKLLCLSRSVVDSLHGMEWKSVTISEHPHQSSLLKELEKMKTDH